MVLVAPVSDPQEQAAENVRVFLVEAIRKRNGYVSVYDALESLDRRPELDDATRYAYEVESKPGIRFTILMPSLPLDALREHRGVPSFRLPAAERRAYEIRIEHASGTTTGYWSEAAISCGHMADYRTREQALDLLFARM